MPKSLTIRQPKLMQRSYLLFDGDKVVGRLDQTGVFRTRTTASIGNRTWRYIKKSGLRETVVIVTLLDSDEAVATYSRSAFRQTGSLLLDGAEYPFKVGVWKSRYTWNDKDGEALVTFNMGGFFKRSGNIEITDLALTIPDYELLLPLGLFLGMDVEDSNAAVAGGAGTVAVTSSGA